MDSYGQEDMCVDEREWRAPVQGHPFELCGQGMTTSGQIAACSAEEARGNSAEQEGHVAVFSGYSALWD